MPNRIQISKNSIWHRVLLLLLVESTSTALVVPFSLRLPASSRPPFRWETLPSAVVDGQGYNIENDADIATPATKKLQWISLTDDGGVQKAVLQPGHENNSGPFPDGSSSTRIISYKGQLVDAHWSTDEVILCWLTQQQGITKDDILFQIVRDHDIDEAKLIDTEHFFTESFVQATLGISSKIICKKLVMAARRLGMNRCETMAGTIFDRNDNYTVTQSSTLIRGMGIGLATMTVGEIARIQIRSDYAYGAEGYRRSTGQVVVPPFATLDFQVHLKSLL